MMPLLIAGSVAVLACAIAWFVRGLRMRRHHDRRKRMHDADRAHVARAWDKARAKRDGATGDLLGASDAGTSGGDQRPGPTAR